MDAKIYVDGGAIRRNKETGGNEPVVCCLQDGTESKGHEISLVREGKVVAKVVYCRHAPLVGGQVVWIEPTNGTQVEVDMKNVCGAIWVATDKEVTELHVLFSTGKIEKAKELLNEMLQTAAVQSANLVRQRIQDSIDNIEVKDD